MPLQIPKSKAGIASIFLGIGLFLLGIGHLLQGATTQAFADFAGAVGTLGLPAMFGTGTISPQPSPVTIKATGPVTVVESPPAPMTEPHWSNPGKIDVRRGDEH